MYPEEGVLGLTTSYTPAPETQLMLIKLQLLPMILSLYPEPPGGLFCHLCCFVSFPMMLNAADTTQRECVCTLLQPRSTFSFSLIWCSHWPDAHISSFCAQSSFTPPMVLLVSSIRRRVTTFPLTLDSSNKRVSSNRRGCFFSTMTDHGDSNSTKS